MCERGKYEIYLFTDVTLRNIIEADTPEEAIEKVIEKNKINQQVYSSVEGKLSALNICVTRKNSQGCICVKATSKSVFDDNLYQIALYQQGEKIIQGEGTFEDIKWLIKKAVEQSDNKGIMR